MAAHSSSIPDSIPFRTLRVSGGVLGLLAVAGLALMALPYLLTDHARFWLALQFNWLFWASLAMGMVMFAVALHLTNARWAWSIRRFALGGVAFLPVATLLFVVVHWGGYEHYFHHWLHYENDPIIDAKKAWLTVPGMFARDIVALLVLTGLAGAFAYYNLRVDVYGAEKVADAGQQAWYRRLTGGYRGVDEEARFAYGRNNYIAVFLGLSFALGWGMIGIDQAMTMEPHFYSTMFPVAFFMAAFHAGIAGTIVAVVLLRPRLRFEEFVTARQFHDLGKLLFAFAVFWMYLNWSQYVVIWYGLLPWEQKWFALRFAEPFKPLAQLVPALIFVVPFLGLLTRPPKKVPGILATFAVVILVGNWIERYMLTVPSVWEGEPGAPLPFGLPEVLIGLGFLGLFAACYLWFAKTFPMLPSPASIRAQGSPDVVLPAAPSPAPQG